MANYQSLKAAINAVIRANGNKEITGTVLNEVLLAMVNSLGAGYQFAGVATPNTNPGTPDQNVFYLAGQAGTYTNFNSIILPNGVSVLKWNGSWSSDTVLAGDGVFDISAYKATGGTNATYADLSAALDGGNNIPSALRKGGMSVKFVRSSDNTYVQFRLMKNQWSTNEDDWQGIDVKPTAGSKNFVESGGVDARMTTDEAEDGVYEIALPASTGVTFSKDIYINIPKGARYAIWVDHTNIISEDVRFVMKYNDSDDVIIRPTNKTWITLLPNVDIYKLHFECYLSFISSSGNIIIRLKKLQSLTSDGKVHLFDGAMRTDGTTFENGNRKTTMVIPNDGPLYLELSSPYRVAYMYGDDPTSLNDGGYITALDGGGRTVLDVNAKYVGFTIVKTDSDTFDNLRFIVTNADSNVARLSKQIDNIETTVNGRLDTDEALIKKAFNTGNVDEEISNTVAAVARTDYENIIPVVLRQGDVIMFRCDSTTNNPYPTLLYDDGSTPLDPTTSQYDVQSPRLFGSWYCANITQDTTFLKAVKYRTLVTDSGDITFRIKRVSALLLREKMFQFMNTTTVSDLKYTLAMACGFDISDKGELYGSITCSEVGYKEYDAPIYEGGIVTANVADIEDTKQTIIAIKQGDRNWQSFPGYYCQWVSAAWGPRIVGDKVHLGVNIGTESTDLLTRKVGLFVRKYDIETGEFDNDLIPCDVNVLGTVYPMQSIYTRATTEDDYVISAETIADIEEIWETTGIEHPARNSGPRYLYMILSQISKCPYDNYFYVPVTMGNESHALCKSLDLIHWEYVCDIPFNQISLEEACVVFATKGTERRIYALSRGQFGADFDNKNGRIMYCPYDVLEDRDNSNWSNPVVFKNAGNERPTLAVLDNILYIMFSRGQACTTDGYSVPRGHKELMTMDLDLNILTDNHFDFTYPILHFHLFAFGGQLWFYTASDKRCFFATHSGDTRNEISFARVDDKILKM